MVSDSRPSYCARRGEAVHVFLDDQLGFAIGNGRITILGDDAVFVDAVIRDIALIAHTAEGEAVLQRGDVLRRPVRITRPGPPTEPPNAWILPDDIAAATAPNAAVAHGTGDGCGSTIVYNPRDWPRQDDPHSPTSAEVLLIALRQANANAGGSSDPSTPDWGVPVPRTRR